MALGELLCSAVSESIDEPLYGTASVCTRWLLVQDQSAWGRNAILEGGIPREVAETLLETCSSQQVRVVLVKRPHDQGKKIRRAFLIDTSPGVARLHVRTLDTRGLADQDLLSLEGWEPSDQEVVLVCTHGRHDVCCAVRGNPIAAALLNSEHQDLVWHASHIGGDRFAGNVAYFPAGIFLGRVPAQYAESLVGTLREGRLPLRYTRGRTGYPFVAQAAEHLLREHLGIDRIDDLNWRGTERLSDTRRNVHFETDEGERWEVTLRVMPSTTQRKLTCAATVEQRPPVYSLESLEVTTTP